MYMILDTIRTYLNEMNDPADFLDWKLTERMEIRKQVRRYIETAAETMIFEIDTETAVCAEKLLQNYGWTLEEAVVLFLLWCVVCPEKMCAWYKTEWRK